MSFNNFPAQLWKLTKRGKLHNKLRTWQYSDTNGTILPQNGTDGYIEVNTINKGYQVMTVRKNSSITDRPIEVVFSPKQTSGADLQQWKLGRPDANGWRTIQIMGLDKYTYLTANLIGPLRVVTVDQKGNIQGVS